MKGSNRDADFGIMTTERKKSFQRVNLELEKQRTKLTPGDRGDGKKKN